MADFYATYPSTAVSSGPIQYYQNGSPIYVSQDSVTPANSKPLPVIITNPDGTQPAGLATAAKQDTGNTSLASIDGKVPALGQALAAGSVPVVLTAAQLATLTPLSTVAATQSGAWTVGVNNFPATQPVSGTVAVSNFPATQAISAVSLPLPTGAATETTLSALNTKVISQASVVSTVNSTTTPLGISGVFTGTSENVKDYASIEVNIFVDQASAALGFSVQQSSNGTNWDMTDVYSIPAGTGKTFSFAPAGVFFRVVYTNGAVAQTAFRLQTVFHVQPTRSSTHSLADTITLQNDSELVIAQLRATNGTNTIPLVANASGGLASDQTAINGVVVLTGNGVSGTGSQRVNIASDNTAFPVLAQASTPVAKTVKSAQISVGTTAIRATTDGAAPTAGRVLLLVRPNAANTGSIYIGANTVTTSNGLLLFPGESQPFNLDAGDYYLISDVAAQSVMILEQE